MAAAVSLPRSGTAPLIELAHVSKEYDTGGGVVRAMRDVSLSIAPGEFVAIVGTSGSGKSTMMNVLGCLDRPTRGTYTLAGIDVGDRAGDSRAIVRNRVIGFIFQGFNLLSRTTALENVELPLQYRGVGTRERRRLARVALEAVGLGDRLDHTPSQLSGGQQQRVAIARALVTSPPLLLADEPTGNLDTRTSLEVLALLQRLNVERGITIVLVTHERDIAACASRVVTMRDGRIVSDAVQERPLDARLAIEALPSADGADGATEASRPRPGSEAPDALRAGGPVPLSVYPAMLVASLIAAVAAHFYMSVGFDRSWPWGIPIASELGAAYAGSRWLRRRLGGPASVDQRVRVAIWYTVGPAAALALSLLLASYVAALADSAWLARSLGAVSLLAARFGILVGALIAACLALVALLRYLLLSLFDSLPQGGR